MKTNHFSMRNLKNKFLSQGLPYIYIYIIFLICCQHGFSSDFVKSKLDRIMSSPLQKYLIERHNFTSPSIFNTYNQSVNPPFQVPQCEFYCNQDFEYDLNPPCPNAFIPLSLFCEPGCETQAKLEFSLLGPGEFYTRISYNETQLNFDYANSPFFRNYSVIGDTRILESYVPIGFCAIGVITKYFINGTSIGNDNSSKFITIDFYDNNDHSIFIASRVVEYVPIRQIYVSTPLTDLIRDNIVLSAQQAMTQHQSIELHPNVELIIDQDYYFRSSAGNANGKTYVRPLQNSKIKVLSGVTLIIDHAHLGDCNNWKGIELMDGATLLINNNINNNRGIADPAIIEKADNGILMHENSIAKVSYTNFINNSVGIHAPFESTNFNRELNIISPLFDGKNRSNSVGMKLYFMPYVPVASVISFHSLRLATFKNLTYGILSYNSTIDMHIPVFTNILNTGIIANKYQDYSSNSRITVDNYIFTGSKSTWTNFENMPRAITAVSTDLNALGININNVLQGIRVSSDISKLVDIQECEIKCGVYGIQGEGSVKGTVNDCYIEVPSSNRTITAGIKFVGTTTSLPWKITNNEIINFSSGNGIQSSNFSFLDISNNPMIHTESTIKPAMSIQGGKDNSIKCNPNIFGEYQGVNVNSSSNLVFQCNLVDGENRGLVINNLCDNSHIISNNINSSSSYSMEYATNPSFFTVTGDQPHNGNCFTGQAVNGKLVKHGYPNAFIVQESQFLVYYTPICHNPQEEAITDQWFLDENGFDKTCQPVFCSQGFVGDPDDDLRNDIISENLGSHPFITEINYTLKNHLYSTLLQENNNSVQYEDFLDSMEVSSSGNLYNIVKQFELGTKLTVIEESAVQANNVIIMSKKDSIRILLSDEDMFNNDYQQWIALFNYLVLSIKELNYQNKQTMDLLDTRKVSAYNTASSEFSNLNAANSIESDIKNLWEIYLNIVDFQDINLTETDKDALIAIANKCPLQGGDIVFFARALLEAYGEELVYNDAAACSPPAQPLSSNKNLLKEKESSSSLDIKDLNTGEIKELILYNVDGKRLNHMKSLGAISEFINNKHKLPDGIYLVELKDIYGKSVTKRISIINK